MVAAGAYLIARLQPFLDTAAWFGPVTIGVGITTALAGGVVAFLHPEAKKLLAASTSAHYGLMFVAVGAGFPAIAIAHLVAHGLFKALLFVSAGVAIDTSGTDRLVGMRLARRLPVVSGLTAVGTLALAAVPPLGAGWTKEQVVAAGTHAAPWVGLLVVVAGGLSALYATRFQLVAYGRSPELDEMGITGQESSRRVRPPVGALAGLTALAAASLGLAALWTSWGEHRLADVVGGQTPPGETWEVAASLLAVALAGYAAFVADRRGLLAAPATGRGAHRVANWFGLPTLNRRAVVDPVLALASRRRPLRRPGPRRPVPGRGVGLGRTVSRGLAITDDRVVDGGVQAVARLAALVSRWSDRVGEWRVDGAVEGLARLLGSAGRDSRRLQIRAGPPLLRRHRGRGRVLVAASLLWR